LAKHISVQLGAQNVGSERAREGSEPSDADVIDMRLFRIPLYDVKPNWHYEVRFKRQKTWHNAFKWGKLWLANDDLVGRVENTAEVRAPKRNVLTMIDQVAERMAQPDESGDEPGVKQYYVDRDVMDSVGTLLGSEGFHEANVPAHLVAACRAIRLAAAHKAMPSTPYSEIAVGYRVTDAAGENLFESLELEEALSYAQQENGFDSSAVGVVFADGSVRYDHMLTSRPWSKYFE
jgi:hypothetical protein